VSSEDDWFESAVEEEEDADGAAEESVEETPEEASEIETSDESATQDELDTEWGEEFSDSGAGAAETDADMGPPEGGADREPPNDQEPASGESDDDGSLFEDDFASALGDVEAPGGAPGGQAGAEEVGQGGFDVGGSPDQPTEGPSAGGFGSGGEDVGDGSEFGMGDLDAGGADFETEETTDSDVERIDLGIEGLDQMIQGGVPARSLMVAIGSAGTGKTTFGLQFLTGGLEEGERAVFIALEETRDSIIESATEKGMAFDEYVESGDLAVIDIDPIEMANSLKNIRSELPDLIQDFGATRLVLDSVSLLEMMYQDRAKRRNEIFDFTRSLKEAGVTTLLVSESSDDNPYASRYGIVEYLTDAVFVLQYVRPSDFRETRLAVEIQKIRDANHSRETKPYDITDEGIDVYRQANIF
jgi:KaiC domain protein